MYEHPNNQPQHDLSGPLVTAVLSVFGLWVTVLCDVVGIDVPWLKYGALIVTAPVILVSGALAAIAIWESLKNR